MKASIDVATRVSAELSSFIEHFLEHIEHDDVVTLAQVRSAVRQHMSGRALHDRLRHPQVQSSMLDETDALIDDFGPDAPAVDFVRSKASEPLSRIIEYLTSFPARRRPTLGTVRDAMTSGLIAELVGDGVIEPDEDQTLISEIDALVDEYGEDVLAEDFVRFE